MDKTQQKWLSQDEHPALSLRTVSNEKSDAREEKEQEALWARSLEYFEDMKKASNAC